MALISVVPACLRPPRVQKEVHGAADGKAIAYVMEKRQLE